MLLDEVWQGYGGRVVMAHDLDVFDVRFGSMLSKKSAFFDWPPLGG